MKRIGILFLFLMLLVLEMTAQSTLELNITNDSREALGEILVLLESSDGLKKKSAFTDSNGNARFNNLSSDEYYLLVDGGLNYSSEEQTVRISDDDVKLAFQLISKAWQLPDVMVASDQAGDLSPIAFENIDRKEIQIEADGREIPMILQRANSVLAHSDAGNGIGYSYMRIRGSDQTRINVTVNGIPLNDSESHQVFWVNMPDFSDNLSSIQIQRGVGQSTFGPGSFGANIKLNTDNQDEDFIRIGSNIASYSSFKNSIALQQKGLQVRLSNIRSQGYIDRAESELNSYFLQYQKQIGKHKFSLMHSNGTERTYQAWNGTPESKAEENDEALAEHIARNSYSEEQIKNLNESNRQYNFYEYENEVDDYQQIHNQIHWSTDINARWSLSSSLHYTKGEGYFEQFREDRSASDFGLSPRIIGNDTISESDVAFQRWLDNDFYGGLFSVVHKRSRSNIKASIFGSQYDGDHFGEIIQSDFIEKGETPQYYSSTSKKKDYSGFVQWNWSAGNWLTTADVQLRHIDYFTAGIDNDLQEFDVDEQYFFINPKLGVQRIFGKTRVYGHFAIGQREPVRSDFIDRGPEDLPQSEMVMNGELGLVSEGSSSRFSLNLFYMNYEDQLVPTGELNDVGALVRRNIDESFRRGIELAWDKLNFYDFDIHANLTLMQSRVKDWEEPIVDYGTGETENVQYSETELALSPNIQSRLELTYHLTNNLNVNLQNQWVGKQYLDNTENEGRRLDDYFIQNLSVAYNTKWSKAKIGLRLSCYNLLDTKYSAFGYSYSYAFNGELTTENFVFPQAERNFNLGIRLEF